MHTPSQILALRKQLHQHPELSGAEAKTAGCIKAFISEHHAGQIIHDLGGPGFAVVYDFGENGKTIAIRCELDALPIAEQNDFSHKSTVDGVSHKCGHDGHMSMVVGLVLWIKEQTFDSGRIVLLFQSAEETGKGAHSMLSDSRFDELGIDCIFAMHNVPGEPMHTVLLMENGFSAEVQSCSIHLQGKEAHASEPENGLNPALALSSIIAEIDKLNVQSPTDQDFSICTPIHIDMGEKSYGISPAAGEIHYTMRAWSPERMNLLKSEVEHLTARIAAEHGLTHRIKWFEYFPASVNDRECNEIISQAATQNGLPLKRMPHPMRFGEDFGWFAQRYPSAMFGLGSGINTPALHHADYDFPDELLPTGIMMFQSIIEQVLAK